MGQAIRQMIAARPEQARRSKAGPAIPAGRLPMPSNTKQTWNDSQEKVAGHHEIPHVPPARTSAGNTISASPIRSARHNPSPVSPSGQPKRNKQGHRPGNHIGKSLPVGQKIIVRDHASRIGRAPIFSRLKYTLTRNQCADYCQPGRKPYGNTTVVINTAFIPSLHGPTPFLPHGQTGSCQDSHAKRQKRPVIESCFEKNAGRDNNP